MAWLLGFKRRWLQFSLRGLLLATLVAAIGMGMHARRLRYANQQRAIVAIVEKCGGRIRYDFDPQPLDFLRPPKRPDGYRFFRKMLGDDYFDTAIEVQLGDRMVPQYAVSKVSGALELIDWKQVNGTLRDEDFEVIVTLNKLHVLRITNSAVTDSAASRLVSLVDLEELQLLTGQLTDRVVEPIVRLPKLRRLALSSRGITDASIEKIGSMKDLEVVDLRGTSVTREGVNRLHELLPKTWITH